MCVCVYLFMYVCVYVKDFFTAFERHNNIIKKLKPSACNEKKKTRKIKQKKRMFIVTILFRFTIILFIIMTILFVVEAVNNNNVVIRGISVSASVFSMIMTTWSVFLTSVSLMHKKGGFITDNDDQLERKFEEFALKTHYCAGFVFTKPYNGTNRIAPLVGSLIVLTIMGLAIGNLIKKLDAVNVTNIVIVILSIVFLVVIKSINHHRSYIIEPFSK